MINKLREELTGKCKEIDNKRTETRIRFETSMTEMEFQRGYLESLIFDIDENVVEEEVRKYCPSCLHFSKSTADCLKGNIPKPSDHAVNILNFRCDEGNWK
jgi:hypothetical protein